MLQKPGSIFAVAIIHVLMLQHCIRHFSARPSAKRSAGVGETASRAVDRAQKAAADTADEAAECSFAAEEVPAGAVSRVGSQTPVDVVVHVYLGILLTVELYVFQR